MSLNSVVERVTARVTERSKGSRRRYLELMERNRQKGVNRTRLSCSNMAHAVAAEPDAIKEELIHPKPRHPNIGIITTYNDMLSAHQPYEHYPEQIKLFAREVGATAQVAAGAPAMCDGVTQGQEGMDLSLFSRDVIGQSTAVGLSHGMYEAAALLGICDKIVPGLLMGALRFGYLPTMLIPGGPMTSGLPNEEKVKIRKLFIEGKVSENELMHAEMASYHAPGTCTFYGTANTNQMVVEFMGLMMPDSAFAITNTPLRQGLTRAAIHRLAEMGLHSANPRPLTEVVTEKSVVNAIVGLMATGGSTNLTIHLPAIARAAGIIIDWEDYNLLSDVVPDLAKIYPSSAADINAFNEAGGVPSVISELISADLLHTDVKTVYGDNLKDYAQRAILKGKDIVYAPAEPSKNHEVLRPLSNPFSKTGGLKMLEGNLGRGVTKVSAVEPQNLVVEAPAKVFHTQDAVKAAQKNGELDQDTVVVVLHQGPRANGMPELHMLIPVLGVQMDKGYHMALVTDGRLSGASGSVPSAVHVWPEAQVGGPLAKVRDGDMIRVDGRTGKLEVLVDKKEFDAREAVPPVKPDIGTGRELFAMMRHFAPCPEEGGSAMLRLMDEDLEKVGDNFSGEFTV
ncbi:phosphogluconate dehydratase [Oecophyllibacter saccharovorans]|uniref:phosphogluconate dehydratase n=1 Tax=Oecophyllibacter saccharovorans TaxID=2558360 RepID=UPI0011432AAE|nr:phosphogluconate dehydratase [Oecophyllibacter saccharovorans]QDH14837.1 phosphogluconate dehydratase [Oecophyllibacter saccharovorans]